MKDLKNKIAVVHLMDPADLVHTDTKSKLLDLANFQGAVLSVSAGALTGVDTSNYLTPKMQESDTTADVDFTDVDAANLEGAFSAINTTALDSVTQYVGYKGHKRYIRVFLDYTGTAISAGVVTVLGILGLSGNQPATGPAAVSAT
jgi:hypothetical protein